MSGSGSEQHPSVVSAISAGAARDHNGDLIGPGRYGWRRGWRVMRVGIFVVTLVVVGTNLVRCSRVSHAAANAPEGASGSQPVVEPR